MNDVKYLRNTVFEQENHDTGFNQEQNRLENMNILLKRVLDNTQVFDTR